MNQEQNTYPSFWFLRDNHTTYKPKGENLVKIAKDLKKIAKKNPDGMICPVIILDNNGKEVKRIGKATHVDGDGNVDINMWLNSIKDDPTIKAFNSKNKKKPFGKLFIFLFLMLIFVGCGNRKYKEYIIEHSSELRKNNDIPNIYNLDTCELSYYTDVTVSLIDDSSYSVVFWGDRDSWLWNWKLDKHFVVDDPYNNHKKINTTQDNEILKIIKSKQ